MITTQTCVRLPAILTLILLITSPNSPAFAAPEVSAEKEREFLAVLRSDAPSADKAIACKNLAIYGSSAAVADLAGLLPDAQLSSWARIALEAIPGDESAAALQAAMDKLDGKLLVGVINSIGVRRDVAAVDALIPRLETADADIAAAAAVALGRIGSQSASDALRSSLAKAPANVRSAIAEGCVLVAERMISDGNTSEAAAVYDEVRNADVPLQRIVEATRGAILARGPEGIPLLMEQFQSAQKPLFQLALTTAREFPGSELDQALAAELNRAAPDRAALILQAMADRPETVILAAVLKAAEEGPTEVRLSAIHALARVGDLSCLDSLLKIAIDPDSELGSAANETLTEIPGENIDKQVVALLQNATGKMYPLLLELVGKRRIDAVPDLLKAINHSDKDVRSAALISLGETVRLQRLSVLISQVLNPRYREDVPIATRALKAASVRMPDREDCASQLAAAIDQTKSIPTKISLLEILGAMGGTRALVAMEAAAKSNDPQLQDISSRLLGEWMTDDAAPVLLNLAKMPNNPYNIRALRGYIRIARQFVLPEEQRVKMCQTAFDAANQAAEKKLVMDVLKRYPGKDTLKQAISAMQVPEIKEEATQATLVIAQKLGNKGVDVKELLAGAGLDKVKLEIIKAEYGTGSTQKDVTELLQQQIGELPLITLTSASYNANFGGDPSPGQKKQLKVKYRINGKTGETSFPEDALIIFPMPK
ncbi:MAG: HEAT repeat domain-containing protein [Planctomycetaceae bacterium]|nr:HEAT repeat domain-containing protein [Planctomycetaceae bacterium]